MNGGKGMEIRFLETFLKVAHTENVSLAAAELDYSQSAVTLHIQQLERTVGVPLFDRLGRGVQLNENGRAFIPHAKAVLQSIQRARHFAHSDVPSGKLRIGCAESIAHTVLPDVLTMFHETYPGVEVVIETEWTPDDMLKALWANELDFMYTFDEPVVGDDLIRAVVVEEPIVFVQKEARSIEAIESLERAPFLLTERGVSYRHALEHALLGYGIRLHPMLEVGDTSLILRLVRRGIGMSFLPMFVVEEAIRSGELHEVDTPLDPLSMERQLIYHRQKWVSPAMHAFLQCVDAVEHN